MFSTILNTSICDDNNMFDCEQIGGDDDNEDMDVDDSYAESGSHVGLDLCRLFESEIKYASSLTYHIYNLRRWKWKGTISGIFSMMPMTKTISMHLIMTARAK